MHIPAVCSCSATTFNAPPLEIFDCSPLLKDKTAKQCRFWHKERVTFLARHPSPLDRMMGQPANSRPRADGPYEYLVTFQVRKLAHQDDHRRNSFPIQECCKNLTASFAPIQTMCPKGLGSMSGYLPSSGTNGCLALLET